MYDFFTEFGTIVPPRDNYIAGGVATSGLDPSKDVMIGFGAVVVRDRRIAERHSWLFDWTKIERSDRGFSIYQVAQDLEDIKRRWHKQGRCWDLDYNYLRREGCHPIEALCEICVFLERAQDDGELFVMHTAWQFEVPFLESALNIHVLSHVNEEFFFRENTVYDVGLIEKASQLVDYARVLPRANETLHDHARRINRMRIPGVRWGLRDACESRYGLHAQAGLDPAAPFRPEDKALLIHRLYESHKQMSKRG